jgi:gas vesicle protein GvpL/GvpF
VTDTAAPVYVYGIVLAADTGALSVSGVNGSPVRTVAHGELAALVSDLDSDALAAAREVRAHWRVLEEAAKGATVLPVRFGTVMESDSALREDLLEHNAPRLTDIMRQLAGRVQLSVKGHYDETELLREVVAASPSIAALRDRTRALPDEAAYHDHIRLGEMVAGEIARRREGDTRRALDLLEPFAVAAHAEPVAGADAAFDLAFLVERTGVDAFSGAVVALGDEVGGRIGIRYVGPLPPYSFAQEELATGSAAWA